MWTEARRRRRSRRASPRNVLFLDSDGAFICSRHLSDVVDFITILPLCQAVVCQGYPTTDGSSDPGQLSCDNHPFFGRVLPILDNIEPFYNRVLSTEGNIFEACTM